jgi:hypothetical protein
MRRMQGANDAVGDIKPDNLRVYAAMVRSIARTGRRQHSNEKSQTSYLPASMRSTAKRATFSASATGNP